MSSGTESLSLFLTKYAMIKVHVRKTNFELHEKSLTLKKLLKLLYNCHHKSLVYRSGEMLCEFVASHVVNIMNVNIYNSGHKYLKMNYI